MEKEFTIGNLKEGHFVKYKESSILSTHGRRLNRKGASNYFIEGDTVCNFDHVLIKFAEKRELKFESFYKQSGIKYIKK